MRHSDTQRPSFTMHGIVGKGEMPGRWPDTTLWATTSPDTGGPVTVLGSGLLDDSANDDGNSLGVKTVGSRSEDLLGAGLDLC